MTLAQDICFTNAISICKQVGLGALGVVTEVTIKCVKRHRLLESTSVMTRAEVKSNHRALLRNNKHIRCGARVSSVGDKYHLDTCKVAGSIESEIASLCIPAELSVQFCHVSTLTPPTPS